MAAQRIGGWRGRRLKWLRERELQTRGKIGEKLTGLILHAAESSRSEPQLHLYYNLMSLMCQVASGKGFAHTVLIAALKRKPQDCFLGLIRTELMCDGKRTSDCYVNRDRSRGILLADEAQARSTQATLCTSRHGCLRSRVLLRSPLHPPFECPIGRKELLRLLALDQHFLGSAGRPPERFRQIGTYVAAPPSFLGAFSPQQVDSDIGGDSTQVG
jgi:hypothetical protein